MKPARSTSRALCIWLPHWPVQRRNPAADLAALEQLALWCERFSPAVGLGPPDNLHLDVTGLAPLFGGEELLAHQLLRDFQSRGLVIRAAIADTFGLAWGLAHYQAEPFTIVPPGQTAAALAELPVAALRVSNAVMEILHELGIDRVGRLLEIPPAAWPRGLIRRSSRLESSVGLGAGVDCSVSAAAGNRGGNAARVSGHSTGGACKACSNICWGKLSPS